MEHFLLIVLIALCVFQCIMNYRLRKEHKICGILWVTDDEDGLNFYLQLDSTDSVDHKDYVTFKVSHK